MRLFTLWVAACAAPLAAGAAAAETPPAPKSVSVEHYRSVGKRMAPVALISNAEYRAEVGETVSVPLIFRTSVDAEAVEVEIVADDGILLSAGRRRVSLGSVARGTFRAPTLQVTPLSAGRHYVTVNLFVSAGASRKFRSFAVPFEVGGGAAQKHTVAPTPTTRGADGRPLHVLPARERH